MRLFSLLCVLMLLVVWSPTFGETMGHAETRVIAVEDSVTHSESTVALFEEVMADARGEALHERPFGEIMLHVGTQFHGKPYAAGMLDEDMEETLVINLEEYDCVTFVESVFALSRGIAVEDYSYEGFKERIQEQRYRGGVMDGYCSRLHYFTEWVADNEKRGLVTNLTRELSGEALKTGLHFMSQHRDSYPQIATSDSLFEELLEVEAGLADFTVYHIPQDAIHEVYDLLEPGDLLALTTDIEGLDVAHTGLAYRGSEGQVGLLHASLTEGVIVSPDLQSYVQNNSRQVGIVVARPADPRAQR